MTRAKQPRREPSIEAMEDALREFVQDIDDLGGIERTPDGLAYPKGDSEWTDLGETYLRACRSLGREPKIYKEDEPDLPRKLYLVVPIEFDPTIPEETVIRVAGDVIRTNVETELQRFGPVTIKPVQCFEN